MRASSPSRREFRLKNGPTRGCDHCADGTRVTTETILGTRLIVDIHAPDIESSYDLTQLA